MSALGDGVVQVSAGRNHSCALKGDGTLWCWGYNEFGTLGDGTLGTLGEANEANYCKATPVQVSALGSSVVRVAAGAYHTCALKTDGTLWCWGRNEYGELGDGTMGGEDCSGLDAGVVGAPCRPTPVQVTALGADVVHVAAGESTCARTTDGLLFCWGANGFGLLGDGTISGEPCGSASDMVCKPSPVPVTALGETVGTIDLEGHVCATKPDGTLFCWGSNRSGELGDGTFSEGGCFCKASPVEVAGLGASVGAACRQR